MKNLLFSLASLILVLSFDLPSATAECCKKWESIEDKACSTHWDTTRSNIRNHEIPNLINQKNDLASKIPSCQKSERDQAPGVEEARAKYEYLKGQISILEKNEIFFNQLLKKIDDTKIQIEVLRPFFIDVLPNLLIELRTFLGANQALHENYLAVLLDERARETQPERQAQLDLQISIVNDLLIVQNQTDGAEVLEEYWKKPTEKNQEPLNWLSPLSRAIVGLTKNTLASYKDGMAAFVLIEDNVLDLEKDLKVQLKNAQSDRISKYNESEVARTNWYNRRSNLEQTSKSCRGYEKDFSTIDPKIQNAENRAKDADRNYSKCWTNRCVKACEDIRG